MSIVTALPSPRISLKNKVERGQRGGYGFEVSLAGADDGVAMISRIAAIYAKLYAEFAPREVA